MPQNLVLGVLTPAEHESDIKNCSEANLRVHTSIFVKFSNLPLGLEIGLNEVLRHAKQKYSNKICVKCFL